jgi:hypothetical protein
LQQLHLQDVVKSTPPGYISGADIMLSVPPVSPTVPAQLLDTGNTTPVPQCECPPTAQRAALHFEKVSDAELKGKFKKAAIQGVISADTDIVDSIKMILAQHGI